MNPSATEALFAALHKQTEATAEGVAVPADAVPVRAIVFVGLNNGQIVPAYVSLHQPHENALTKAWLATVGLNAMLGNGIPPDVLALHGIAPKPAEPPAAPSGLVGADGAPAMPWRPRIVSGNDNGSGGPGGNDAGA